jgi:hypothetical protein
MLHRNITSISLSITISRRQNRVVNSATVQGNRVISIPALTRRLWLSVNVYPERIVMAIRKHDPVSEKEMAWISPNYTICQVLREIYYATDDPGIRINCRVATSMAKSMTRKLSEYKKGWEADFWDPNPDKK